MERPAVVDGRGARHRPRANDVESHWASEHFEDYDPAVDGQELADALKEHERRSLGEASTISFANLDVRPYPHQQRMLEALMVERERHGRHRNLVVAATGTTRSSCARSAAALEDEWEAA